MAFFDVLGSIIGSMIGDAVGDGLKDKLDGIAERARERRARRLAAANSPAARLAGAETVTVDASGDGVRAAGPQS